MSNEILIGRQPIFDRDYNVVAYEMLFRGGAQGSDVEMTSQVMVNAVMDIGLENIAGALPVFFNIDESFLLHETGLSQALPQQQVVLEVLEHVNPGPAVLEACRNLKDAGYTLALDDVISVEHARPFVDLVDIIKVDWIEAEEDPGNIISAFRHENVKFLAEKIDSYEEAEKAKALGFDLYQGYFYCKPDIVSGSKPPESRMSVLRAMQQAMTATSIDEMFDVVKQDVTLSYRLLKYINSAAFALRREVQSIEQALSLLGLSNIRRWLTLLTMTSLAENKPKELIRQALWRARFLEMLARAMGDEAIEDDFLTGLFSILDALLDCSMQESLVEVSLAEHVHNGLIDARSAMGEKLAVARALETGDWDVIRLFSNDGKRITYAELTRLQTESMLWADQQMAALSAL
ncbi:putative signal transduction protein containing EAL and modified HD-GYP domains [Mariprofundus micogutta]|uniref:Putative signal transduction protein containing EAL and modified HD-GYP domains n=1 Tax=Mariprofundus micogutta TaxID=1921010 RepID=A0A1L8CM18_9PROT|nr:HDOD domain-containing protein [Mariprofundus micogutta]GAV19958.1 putative signal transduction protein containing EAL and modified HD-GYP domains [Mariprofundus micogutta]